MKYKVLLILLCFNFQIQCFSQEYTSLIIDEFRIGAWAMHQHNNIAKKIYEAIRLDSISAYDNKYRKLDYSLAFHYFDDRAIKHYTIDSQTSYYLYIQNKCLFFNIEERYFGVLTPQAGKIINIEKAALYKILNKEELLYLDLYVSNKKISFASLPHKSKSITSNINLKLYNESIDYFKRTENFDSIDKIWPYYQTWSRRGMNKKAVFIRFNPNDSNEGYDSIVLFPINITDSSKFTGYFFNFINDGLTLKITEMSSGYHSLSGYNPVNGRSFIPVGFLNYNRIKSFNEKEKSLLSFVLKLTIHEKLSHRQPVYDLYINEFNLETY